MKKVFALVAAFTAISTAGAAAAETITFENLSAGFVSNPFVQGSATFSSPGQLFVGNYGTNQICSVENGTCAGLLNIAFAQSTSNLNFTISGVDASTSILTALVTFDSGNTTTRTFTNFTGGNAGNSLVDFGSLSGIRNLALSTNDSYGFSYDNINFSSSVPEPASWAMMILGMGAVGGALRRRSKVSTTVKFA